MNSVTCSHFLHINHVHGEIGKIDLRVKYRLHLTTYLSNRLKDFCALLLMLEFVSSSFDGCLYPTSYSLWGSRVGCSYDKCKYFFREVQTNGACLVTQLQFRPTCLSVVSPDLARLSSISSSVLKCHILYDLCS